MKLYWNIVLLFFLFHCAGSRTVSDIKINRELSRPQFEMQAIQKVNVEVQYVRKKWIFDAIIPVYSETLLNTEKGDIVISESVDLHKSPLIELQKDSTDDWTIGLFFGHLQMYSDFFIADGKSKGAKAYLLSKAVSSVREATVLIDPSFSEQCNNVQGVPLFPAFTFFAINESSCTLQLRTIAGKTVFKG